MEHNIKQLKESKFSNQSLIVKKKTYLNLIVYAKQHVFSTNGKYTRTRHSGINIKKISNPKT